jgi:hypothetical protein
MTILTSGLDGVEAPNCEFQIPNPKSQFLIFNKEKNYDDLDKWSGWGLEFSNIGT